MPTRAARPLPRGLTTIEVVVALTLLSGGVLATLSVHASLSAMTSRAHQRRLLAVRTTSILDSLRAIPCAAAASGSSAVHGGTITWRVTRGPGGTFTARATTTPPMSAPWHAETIIPCP